MFKVLKILTGMKFYVRCYKAVTSVLQGSYKQGRGLQDYLTTFGDLDMPPQAGLKQNRVVSLAEAHNSFYFRLELTNASI